MAAAIRDELADAIARAGAFISEQLLAGNYGLACHGSDDRERFSNNKGHVFCGFFIAEALADQMKEVERTVLLVRALSEDVGGSWGFSPPHPFVGPEHESFVVDVDDTAYVLRTFRLLGAYFDPKRLFRFHDAAARAFYTFKAAAPLENASRLEFVPAFENNLLFHPEVNGNAFLVLKGTRFGDLVNFPFIERCQHPDGYWRSYFYPGRYFANPIFVELLRDEPSQTARVARTIDFLKSSQNADDSWGLPGNPYETALALKALLLVDPAADAVRRGLGRLLRDLAADGSWRSPNVVWEYHDRGKDVWRAFDVHRTFVSALCLTALKMARDADAV